MLKIPLASSGASTHGTSAGAIVAAAAAMGRPMAELREAFIQRGSEAFQRRRISSARNLFRLLSTARYDQDPLARLVNELAGDARLADLDRILAITATRLADADAILFEPGDHGHVPVREAVLASAAAPTMFPAVAIGGALHADGAMFANAPDLLAMELAIRSGAAAADVSMLSIGSMNSCPPLGEPDGADMGVLDWIRANRVFRTMIGAQAAVTARMMSALLGERYLRIDADPDFPGRSDVALDKADAKAVAAARTAADMSRHHLDAWRPVAGASRGFSFSQP